MSIRWTRPLLLASLVIAAAFLLACGGDDDDGDGDGESTAADQMEHEAEPGVVADIGRYFACLDPPPPLRR